MLRTRRRLREASAEANPMDGVANMADVMLVLAVGIMLALILNWNVDISAASADRKSKAVNTDEALTFTEDDLSRSTEASVDEGALQKLGAVYYDEASGTYYVIQEDTP